MFGVILIEKKIRVLNYYVFFYVIYLFFKVNNKVGISVKLFKWINKGSVFVSWILSGSFGYI